MSFPLLVTDKQASHTYVKLVTKYKNYDFLKLIKIFNSKLNNLLTTDQNCYNKYTLYCILLEIHVLDSLIRIKRIFSKFVIKMQTDWLYEITEDTFYITKYCYLLLDNKSRIEDINNTRKCIKNGCSILVADYIYQIIYK